MSIDKYNSKRKYILEKLDNGYEVSITELGMYDLTTYFDKKKFHSDLNLTETILINKNLERRIQHINDEKYFSPVQIEALNILKLHKRVVLLAPTSFGKTLLVKEYIYVNKPRYVVYIVPTNALAYELENSFKKNLKFSDYIIFDKCIELNKINNINCMNENLLFVGTQEKYMEISSIMNAKVDLFIIDEAYKLQETVKQQRGYILSEVFLNSITNSSNKVFLLAPNANLIGFDKYNFFQYESNFNAVDKNFIVLKKEVFYVTLMQKSKKEKTILFCKNPSQISESYNNILNIAEVKSNLLTEFIRQLENDVHPDWIVVKLLRLGIVTHHGQMPKYVQNKMINLFNKNEQIKLLFGTNSISEGINTVTKNLFIYPDYQIKKNALLLKNTIGRAGRLGEYPIGYIYSTENIKDKIQDNINISLAISDEEELNQIEKSNNDDEILKFSKNVKISFESCKKIINDFKISLLKLQNILNSLNEDCKFSGISNLPFIAKKAFGKEYPGIIEKDKIIIRGYLQDFWKDEDNNRRYLNNFNDRIEYFNSKYNKKISNTEIINNYMLFIYSTLEYCIMPLVNIGLEIQNDNKTWNFGKNVVASLEECKKKYYSKSYGQNINYDELSKMQKGIIDVFKDYGMISELKRINIEILNEISENLNVRYSTFDVLNAIEKLTQKSQKYKTFYVEIVRKYK